MQDSLTISARLADLRPALSGRLVAVVTSTRVFADFGPPR
jgi:hypothetical protein